jgi:hypothetical protein
MRTGTNEQIKQTNEPNAIQITKTNNQSKKVNN